MGVAVIGGVGAGIVGANDMTLGGDEGFFTGETGLETGGGDGVGSAAVSFVSGLESGDGFDSKVFVVSGLDTVGGDGGGGGVVSGPGVVSGLDTSGCGDGFVVSFESDDF